MGKTQATKASHDTSLLLCNRNILQPAQGKG
jgi:hypothetical protein